MRLVKLTIIYDMDDDTMSLDAELDDWLEGKLTAQDLDCKVGAGAFAANMEANTVITLEEYND